MRFFVYYPFSRQVFVLYSKCNAFTVSKIQQKGLLLLDISNYVFLAFLQQWSSLLLLKTGGDIPGQRIPMARGLLFSLVIILC